MIRDLAGEGSESRHKDADVLIIGAGIAGLLMAERMSASGLNVVVVESGGAEQRDETHPLNEVVQLGHPYSGAEHGRFRCLGGTSTRWGGALLPFLREDMGPHTAGWEIAWEPHYDELLRYLPEIEKLFRLPKSDYEAPHLLTMTDGSVPEFLPRMAKWPPFRLRNIATLLTRELRGRDNLEVWLNATITSFKLDENGRMRAARTRCINGGALTVRAGIIVIAAGAIESTRLLLIVDKDHDGRLFAPYGILGRYFYDHLSAPAAGVVADDVAALNALTGFRFERGGMRNLRFEFTGEARHKYKLPAGFTHISFSDKEQSGFDALRNIYRALQRRCMPEFTDLTLLSKNSLWLARAAMWRYVHRRLLVPDNAEFELHLVMEQEPVATNRIGLSAEKRDCFGCPLATIDWHIADNDLESFDAIYSRFAAAWENSNFAKIARLVPRAKEDRHRRLVAGGGIYHPGGSARIGRTRDEGVVDGSLRTHCVPNLRVVSTAVFPSGGGANPTLMLMLFALRAADEIVVEIKRSRRT